MSENNLNNIENRSELNSLGKEPNMGGEDGEPNRFYQQNQQNNNATHQQSLGNNSYSNNGNSGITERLINNFLYQFSNNNNNQQNGQGHNIRHGDIPYSNQITQPGAPVTGFIDVFSNNNGTNSLFQQSKMQQQVGGANTFYPGNTYNNTGPGNVNQALDPQAILNMSWLQQYSHQPNMGQKAVLAVTPQQNQHYQSQNNQHQQYQSQQQHYHNQQQHYQNQQQHYQNQLVHQQQKPQLVQQQKPQNGSMMQSKAKSKLVQDLSMLTQQQINQISPILQVSNNGSMSSAQFKSETRTQKRVTKRKSLLKMGPKRPSSAYFFYCQAVRSDLQKEFPQMKVPEMQKKLGQNWKELTEEEKAPYKKQQQVAWDAYKVAREEYVRSLPPKKPSGPFVAYVMDQKERFFKKSSGKKLDLREITAMCVEEWKNLDEETKLKYNLSFKEKIKDWKNAYEELENRERNGNQPSEPQNIGE